MNVNNQIMTCQKYPLTFQGENKEKKESHLIRNTVIAGTAGAGFGGILGYINHNNVKQTAQYIADYSLKNGRMNKESAEIYLNKYSSRSKTAKIGAITWGIITTVGYLGYRGIKHMLKGKDSD